MSKPNWYKENRDEAMNVFADSSDDSKIAASSPIYPTSSETHPYRKNNGTAVEPGTVTLFKQKFPYSQLSRGNGACYFNAVFAAILHDCVGDAKKWCKFRQRLEILFSSASFADGKNINDFIVQIDEDKEFPTREKVNEILTKRGDENIVTQLAKNLLVDSYGQLLIDSSKEFIIQEAANFYFEWNDITGKVKTPQQQWNALINDYKSLNERADSTLKNGERKTLTEALDFIKAELIKEIVKDSELLDSFWTNVVDRNKGDLTYGLQNLGLYEAAKRDGKLAATYDGNQIKPFFDFLYPESRIVSISNDGMQRAISVDGHPKKDTIYLYNPNGHAHFSVLHADLDKRIFNDLSQLATSVDTRKLYDSPKNQKDLLGTEPSARKMIWAEVELARSSSIAKMQEGTDKSAISLVEQFSKSNNPILEKGIKSYTPLEAAEEKFTAAKQELHKKLEEKIRTGEIKVDSSEEAKHTIIEKEILEYSAKGILSKALRANAIEKRAKTEAGKKKNLVNKITFETIKKDYAEVPNSSGKLEIQFGRRYTRKDFIGDAATKLKFNDTNFGDNSFANCTFTNCDFSKNSGKRLNFVNCTFDEGCVLPENLRNKDNNFVGCKFNKEIFEGMTNADELKIKLGILTDAVTKDGFYQSEKPSSSISSGAAFKLRASIRSH